ncbi:MAG: ABC transporter substrate-binding protein [Chloroflexi bacterium]|nr:ABC transporter substrate-binding protein [Chloroflexota bacterium]
MIKKYVLISFILITMLVSACAPAAVQPTIQAPTSPPAAAPTQAPPPQPQPTAPTAARLLRLAHSWGPLKIDPAIGSDFAAQSMMVNLYDTLLFPTTDGKLNPWVADSFDVSSDGLTYTFHLKKGIKFHDGTELKASDVVFSMNRDLTIGQGMAYMFVNRVQSTKALDDYTVEFTINKPYALFPQTLVRLWIMNEKVVKANTQAEGQYGENGDYGTTWLLTHDAGSGPYKVKEFQLEEYMLMEKNNDWWAKDKFVPNAPDLVRVIPIPEAATLRTLMANRELEISDQWQSADTFRSLEKIEGVKIATFDAVTMLYIYLNTKKPPLDDVHFRRAVAYAFDYETAANIDWPGTKVSRAPVPMGVPGANPNLTPYEHSVDKAKAELAQSKYANELDKYPVTFYWNTDVPDTQKYALLFQSSLAEAGINVKIEGTPWLTLTQLASKAETSPDAWPLYLNADLPEAGALLYQRYDSSTQGTFFQGEWLGDKYFDEQIALALSEQDQATRFQMYADLQKYIMDLSPSLYVFDQYQKHAYQDYLDWPATKGTVYPVMGYNQFFAFIGVNPH